MSTFDLSRDQVRELDRRAIEDCGMPSVVLMENAGRGCAELLMRLNPERQPVAVLCGPGNNGGDGFVIARHLDNHGWPVQVWLIVPDEQRSFGFGQVVAANNRKLATDCLVNAEIWTHFSPLSHNDPRNKSWTESLVKDVTNAAWIVDALFGTGLNRPLETPYQELIPFLNVSTRPILAVDLPTGLDCDSGEPNGPTVRATHTATFVAPKRGFQNPSARDWTGEVHVIDIGVPRAIIEAFRQRDA